VHGQRVPTTGHVKGGGFFTKEIFVFVPERFVCLTKGSKHSRSKNERKDAEMTGQAGREWHAPLVHPGRLFGLADYCVAGVSNVRQTDLGLCSCIVCNSLSRISSGTYRSLPTVSVIYLKLLFAWYLLSA